VQVDVFVASWLQRTRHTWQFTSEFARLLVHLGAVFVPVFGRLLGFSECDLCVRIPLRRNLCGIEFTEPTMSDVVEDDVNERLTGLETNVAHIFVAIGEMKADNRDLRIEVKDFRNEARGEAKDLRNEFTHAKDALTARIEGLSDRMERLRVEIVMTKVWMLGTSAAILGVMARGFHWI
jgi:hypothetical protein